jgi:hypothetical protein
VLIDGFRRLQPDLVAFQEAVPTASRSPTPVRRHSTRRPKVRSTCATASPSKTMRVAIPAPPLSEASKPHAAHGFGHDACATFRSSSSSISPATEASDQGYRRKTSASVTGPAGR